MIGGERAVGFGEDAVPFPQDGDHALGFGELVKICKPLVDLTKLVVTVWWYDCVNKRGKGRGKRPKQSKRKERGRRPLKENAPARRRARAHLPWERNKSTQWGPGSGALTRPHARHTAATGTTRRYHSGTTQSAAP